MISSLDGADVFIPAAKLVCSLDKSSTDDLELHSKYRRMGCVSQSTFKEMLPFYGFICS